MTKNQNLELKKFANFLYIEKVQKFKNKNFLEKDLNDNQVKSLALVITDLPYSYQVLLKAKFIYKMTPSEVEKVFTIEDPKSLLIFVADILSRKLDLQDQVISDKSLEAACILVEKSDLIDANKLVNNELDFKPTKTFKKTLKRAGLDPRRLYEKILKRVASFILIVLSSLLIFLSFNVAAREKFFDWIIKDFGLYSTFTPKIIDPDFPDAAKLKDLKIMYVPDGFELKEEKSSRLTKNFWYINSDNDDLFFSITFHKLVDENSISMYDTEDAVLEEVFINGNKGYYWAHGTNMVLWQQNNIECFISGSISREEIIKIAESISK